MSDRERFSVYENGSIRKRSLEERLRDLPEVRARVERMLDLIENAAGDVEKAAEAERRVTEELRQMGNEVLHGWARRQEQKKEEKFNDKEGVNRKGKKPLLVHAIRENRKMLIDLAHNGAKPGSIMQPPRPQRVLDLPARTVDKPSKQPGTDRAPLRGL